MMPGGKAKRLFKSLIPGTKSSDFRLSTQENGDLSAPSSAITSTANLPMPPSGIPAPASTPDIATTATAASSVEHATAHDNGAPPLEVENGSYGGQDLVNLQAQVPTPGGADADGNLSASKTEASDDSIGQLPFPNDKPDRAWEVVDEEIKMIGTAVTELSNADSTTDDSTADARQSALKRVERALERVRASMKEFFSDVYDELHPSPALPKVEGDFDECTKEVSHFLDTCLCNFTEGQTEINQKGGENENIQASSTAHKFGKGVKKIVLHVAPFAKFLVEVGKSDGLLPAPYGTICSALDFFFNAIKARSERREEFTKQLKQATGTLERLRIVKDIPKGYSDDICTQAKTMDILAAIVNLIGQQLSYFTILQKRPQVLQKTVQVMKNVISPEDGAYKNAQMDLEGSVADFNQCLHDLGLKITFGILSTLKDLNETVNEIHLMNLLHRRDRLSEWLLGRDSFNARHEFLRGRRALNSGQWFRKQIDKWLQGTSTCCIARGNPGSGKSFLTSLVIDRLYAQGDTPIFIYFQRELHSTQTSAYIRKSFTGQLLMADVSSPPDEDLLQVYEKARLEFRDGTPSQDFFTTTCSQFSNLLGKIVVIFDALDESEPSQLGEICDFIETLRSCGIRTYVTTRSHTQSFLGDNLSPATDLKITATDDDVKSFLLYEIKRRKIKLEPDIEKEIVGRISDGIDGMFLLAAKRLEYVIGGGSRPSQKHMKTRSSNLRGTTLKDFYRQIIKEIIDLGDPTAGQALQAIYWVWNAKEPLTEEVLRKAVDAKRAEDILEACRSLLVLSGINGFVQFSHTTTITEFLSDPTNFEDLGAHLPNALDLAKRCLSYLDSPEFESINVDYVPSYEPPSRTYGFGGYAATNWAEYVRGVDFPQRVEDLSYFRFLAAVPTRESVLRLNRRPTSSTILHVLAEKGLSRLCGVFFEAKARSAENIVLELTYSSDSLPISRDVLEEQINVDKLDSNGDTALHRAAVQGHIDVVMLLVQYGANVDVRDQYGRTPLSRAAARGHLKAVTWLVYEAVADVESKDNGGWTPLSRAAVNGHLEAVKLLVEEAGANVDSKDEDGQTPLSCAAMNGHLEMVKLLVKAKAAVESKDEDGQTPLSCAAENGHMEAVKFLVEAGANVESKDSEWGWTPLSRAARNGHLEVVKFLVKEAGADVTSKDSGGRAPLSWAAENGHLEIMKFLVNEAGADIESKDNEGRTPLSLAAYYGRLEVGKFLVKEAGSNVESKDWYGQTPLSRAAFYGRLEAVKFLVKEAGADVDATDNDGKTALELARQEGAKERPWSQRCRAVAAWLEEQAHGEDSA